MSTSRFLSSFKLSFVLMIIVFLYGCVTSGTLKPMTADDYMELSEQTYDSKISALAAKAAPLQADYGYIVDMDDTSSKKFLLGSLLATLSIDDLVTLSGIAEGTAHLGTFTGSTISDSVTIKAAAQELETALELKANSASPTLTGTVVLPSNQALLGSPTFATSILPAAAGVGSVGSADKEVADVFLGDGGMIKGQSDQSATLTSSASLWTANNFAVGTQFRLPSTDANPTSTIGYFRHDSTVSNFTGGALAYYNGSAIKQVVDMTTATATACTDDYVVAYDADADLWYCKEDLTAGAS